MRKSFPHALALSVALFWSFCSCSLPSKANAESDPSHLIQEPAAQVTVTDPQGSFASVELGSSQDLVIRLKKHAITLSPPQPHESDYTAFAKLSGAEKIKFNRNRQLFLTQFAKALYAFKYGFGVGSVVKNQLKFVVAATSSPLTQFIHGSMAVDPNLTSNSDLKYDRYSSDELDNEIRQSFKERSEEIVLNLVKAIDRTLWKQAALFADTNEVGFMSAIGAEFFLRIPKMKGRGRAYDVGLSVGYNRSTQAIVFQIFRDVEKFKDTISAALFITGSSVKSGMYIANQQQGEMSNRGTAFYPPMVPGFSTLTNDRFITGFSSGITLPPSPFGDLLTYSTYLDQKAWLRISISPLFKGFIKVETSLSKESIKASVYSVLEVVKSLGRRSRSSISCNLVHQI